MSKETKMITSSVNLPSNIIKNIINVDDRRMLIPIDEAMEMFKKNKVEYIRTLKTSVSLDNRVEYQAKYANPEYINISHGISYINNIEKYTINDENMKSIKENLKFYNIHLEYSNGRESDLIVPSYIKFYSMHKGYFVAVEQLKSRDILCEYGDYMVNVSDAKLIENYDIPKEYYNIKVTFESDHPENAKEYPNFYINGILTNVAYYNFNKTIEDASVNME